MGLDDTFHNQSSTRPSYQNMSEETCGLTAFYSRVQTRDTSYVHPHDTGQCCPVGTRFVHRKNIFWVNEQSNFMKRFVHCLFPANESTDMKLTLGQGVLKDPVNKGMSESFE